MSRTKASTTGRVSQDPQNTVGTIGEEELVEGEDTRRMPPSTRMTTPHESTTDSVDSVSLAMDDNDNKDWERPSLMHAIAQRLCSRHLLLQGPPQSGRSSLLMDLAYHVASHQSCRCPNGANPCSCTAVLVFRPIPSTTHPTAPLFPLPCHPITGEAATRKRKRSCLPQSHPFVPEVLRRIQIRWIASFRDLLYQLWTLQAMPSQDQPRAVLVDDLDHWVSSSYPPLTTTPPGSVTAHQSDVVDSVTMRSRQSLLLAVILDTANCLTTMQQTITPESEPVWVMVVTTNTTLDGMEIQECTSIVNDPTVVTTKATDSNSLNSRTSGAWGTSMALSISSGSTKKSSSSSLSWQSLVIQPKKIESSFLNALLESKDMAAPQVFEEEEEQEECPAEEHDVVLSQWLLRSSTAQKDVLAEYRVVRQGLFGDEWQVRWRFLAPP